MKSQILGAATIVGNGVTVTDECWIVLYFQIPEKWSAVAYPSLKPLGAWVTDLLARLAFFGRWVQNGPPTIAWISGFFFTQVYHTYGYTIYLLVFVIDRVIGL